VTSVARGWSNTHATWSHIVACLFFKSFSNSIPWGQRQRWKPGFHVRKPQFQRGNRSLSQRAAITADRALARMVNHAAQRYLMTSAAQQTDTFLLDPTRHVRAPMKAPSPGRRKRVLLVGHDNIVSHRLAACLVDMGFDVIQAWRTDQAVQMFRNLFHVIDIVLLSVDLPDQDSLVAFEWMKYIDSNVRVLLLTDGVGRDERVESAIRQGALGAMSHRSEMLKSVLGADDSQQIP
jgi:hypothetical protein